MEAALLSTLAEHMDGNACQPEKSARKRFPKESRIKNASEFEQVYRQGKRLHGDGFTLIFAANALGHSRLGISVYRRLQGALKRNRIKRIVRESFRLYQEVYPEASDIVMAVRSGKAFVSPILSARNVAKLTGKSFSEVPVE